MESRKFIWLAPECYPRRGPKLETGKIYDVSDFDDAVVAHWVKEKAARYHTEKKSGKEE